MCFHCRAVGGPQIMGFGLHLSAQVSARAHERSGNATAESPTRGSQGIRVAHQSQGHLGASSRLEVKWEASEPHPVNPQDTCNHCPPRGTHGDSQVTGPESPKKHRMPELRARKTHNKKQLKHYESNGSPEAKASKAPKSLALVKTSKS